MTPVETTFLSAMRTKQMAAVITHIADYVGGSQISSTLGAKHTDSSCRMDIYQQEDASMHYYQKGNIMTQE